MRPPRTRNVRGMRNALHPEPAPQRADVQGQPPDTMLQLQVRPRTTGAGEHHPAPHTPNTRRYHDGNTERMGAHLSRQGIRNDLQPRHNSMARHNRHWTPTRGMVYGFAVAIIGNTTGARERTPCSTPTPENTAMRSKVGWTRLQRMRRRRHQRQNPDPRWQGWGRAFYKRTRAPHWDISRGWFSEREARG